MEKQPFDHFDRKIREAADNVSTHLSEAAWQRMENLLDQEEKKNNKFFYWKLISLFVVMATGWLIYTSNTGKTVSHNQSDKSAQPTQHTAEAATTPAKNSGDTSPKQLQSIITTTDKDFNAPDTGNHTSDLSVHLTTANIKRNSSFNQRMTYHDADKIQLQQKHGAQYQQPADRSTTGEEFNNKQQTMFFSKPTAIAGQYINFTTSDIQTPFALGKVVGPLQTIKNADSGTASKAKNDRAKSKRKLPKPLSKLYFTAAIGADAFGIKSYNWDKPVAIYGAGAGYQLSQRLSIQSGFYAVKKTYKATPQDYKVKPGSYLSMVDLLSVDANCTIYEVPLSARYNIVQKNKLSVYAVSGFTTTIMKKEAYKYHYKRNGVYGQSMYNFKGNAHVFSTINASAGFEHAVLPGIFLQVEPYVKIPIAGVGEGKVKLDAMGIQFGIKYQPFRKKNNK